MKLSIVIPCYNEKKYITEVIRRVQNTTLPSGVEREIIIVNDGSTDNTEEILKKFSTDIHVINKVKNEGKGAAVKLGLQSVKGDYVIIQDADLEYYPEDYQKLLEPVLQGKSDVVFGSRNLNMKNRAFSKAFYYGSMLLTKNFNILFNTHFTDIFSCYKLFPATFIEDLIFQPSNDFVFDGVELTYVLAKRASRTQEVPIAYKSRNRSEGKKIKAIDGVKSLLAMLRIKSGLDQFIRNLRAKEAIHEIKKDAIVLDVGCGKDCFLLRQVKDTIKFGYGIDKKIKSWKNNHLNITEFDFDNFVPFPFKDHFFDQVTSLAVLEHVYHPEFMVEQIYRCLKKDGQIILTTPSKAAKPVLEFLAFKLRLIDEEEIRDHKHYFSKQELLDLFKKIGFKDIKHQYFELGFNHLIIARK
jgi:dolichol-phosphate mannosyltransferase